MNSTTIRHALRGPVLAVALAVAVAGTAFATGANGFHAGVLAHGTLAGPVQLNMGVIKFQTKADIDVVTATVNLDAHASSGWHSHPGIVIVTVLSGTVTFYDDLCVGTPHAAGTTFIEANGVTGLARNESDATAQVYVTYLVPAGTPNSGLRIDQLNPGCPQT